MAGVEPVSPKSEATDKQKNCESQGRADSPIASPKAGTQWDELAEIVKVWHLLTPESRTAILGIVKAMKGGAK